MHYFVLDCQIKPIEIHWVCGCNLKKFERYEYFCEAFLMTAVIKVLGGNTATRFQIPHDVT